MGVVEFRNQLMRDKGFREAYEKKDLAFEIGQAIMEARIKKGWTQEDLAKKVNTRQPSIARLESGASLPSLSFIVKITKVLDLAFDIRFNIKPPKPVAQTILNVLNKVQFFGNKKAATYKETAWPMPSIYTPERRNVPEFSLSNSNIENHQVVKVPL
jgi:transcriptional regulator with XRE-family HTH domain